MSTAAAAAADTTTNGAAGQAEPPTAGTGAPTGYEDEEVLHKLADVLRTTMKIRNGVLQETRVDYFKGAFLFVCLWLLCLVGVWDHSVDRSTARLLINSHPPRFPPHPSQGRS